VARFEHIGINHKLATLDVDSRELAYVVSFELRADLLQINGVAPTGELVFAAAGFS